MGYGVDMVAYSKRMREHIGCPKALSLLIVCSLLLSVPIAVAEGEGPPTVPDDGIAGEDGPIIIDGDAQLIAAVAAYCWTGNGSKDNPYVIEGLNINGSGSQFCMGINAVKNNYLLIRNNRFSNTIPGAGLVWKMCGLAVQSCLNATIENNTIENAYGIGLLVRSTAAVVTNNTVNDCGQGIDTFAASTNLFIFGNTFNGVVTGINCGGPVGVDHNVFNGTGPSTGLGMHVSSQVPASFNYNTISNFSRGMDLGGGVYRGNIIRDCGNYAMKTPLTLASIEDSTIVNCTTGIQIEGMGHRLHRNTLVGSPIVVMTSNEDHVRSYSITPTNTFNGKPIKYLKDGINVDIEPDAYGQMIMVCCSVVKMENTTVDEEFWYQAFYCDNVTLHDNDVDLSSGVIWRIYRSVDVVVVGNTFSEISLYLSGERHRVVFNDFDNGSIYSFSSIETYLTNNTMVSDGPTPIHVRHCSKMEIKDNGIHISEPRTGLHGMLLSGNLEGMVLRRNVITGAGIAGPWAEEDRVTHLPDIDTSNTVNGRPILCLDEAVGGRFSGDYGQIIMNTSSGVVIDYVDMGPYDGGISMVASRDILIDHCSFDTLMNGAVYARYSGNVSVTNCLFRGGYSGVRLLNGNLIATQAFGEVSRNYFMNIMPPPEVNAALFLSSSRLDAINSNYIADIKGCGIRSTPSNGNAVGEMKGNEFVRCSEQAIRIGFWNTQVDHNSFIDNGEDKDGSQVTSTGLGCTWDDGNEGNYWSNYGDRYPGATNNGNTWDRSYAVGGSPASPDQHPLVDYVDRVPPWVRIIYNDTTLPFTKEAFSCYAIDNQDVVSYRWSFLVHGARTDIWGPHAEFTFNASGNHRVTLTVWDAVGNSAEAIREVRVIDIVRPLADAGEDLEVPPDTTVTLDGKDSTDDNMLASYIWTFTYDDLPVELKGRRVAFTFVVEGTYVVTLTVSDAAGNTDTDEVNVTVGDTTPPVAFIGEHLSIPQGSKVRLSGIGSTDNWRIDKYEWAITSPGGEVVYYHTAEVTHTFTEAGVHTVTLVVTDPKGLVGEASIKVTSMDITPPVAAAWEVSRVGQNVRFTLDGTNSTDNVAVVQWTWEITGQGENVTLYGAAVHHTFLHAGFHSVLLTVRDDWGNNASIIFTVEVLDTEPPVAVVSDDVEVDEGTIVVISGTMSTDNCEIFGYIWEFTYEGRDVLKYGPTISFTFDLPGVYEIVLTVTDTGGNTGKGTVVVTVRDITDPVADAGDDISVDQHEKVTLDGLASTDNVELPLLLWTFDYGGEEQELLGLTPEFTFDLAGEYLVTLSVIDDAGNQAQDTMTVTVLDIEAPVADAGQDLIFIEGDTATTMWVSSRGRGPSPRVASKGRWKARMPSSYSRSTVNTS